MVREIEQPLELQTAMTPTQRAPLEAPLGSEKDKRTVRLATPTRRGRIGSGTTIGAIVGGAFGVSVDVMELSAHQVNNGILPLAILAVTAGIGGVAGWLLGDRK